MAGFIKYAKSRALRANADVWALAKEHVKGAVVAFLIAIVALPLAAWGTDMKHEAWQVFVDGVIGPCLLYGLVFAFFWLRAPAKLDAERILEIRALRIAQGLSVADLDLPEATSRGRYKWTRYDAMATIGGSFFVVVIGWVVVHEWRIARVEYETTRAVIAAQHAQIGRLKHQIAELISAKNVADALGANRLVEIQGKDGKGGLKSQIITLQHERDAALKKPPHVVVRTKEAAAHDTAGVPVKESPIPTNATTLSPPLALRPTQNQKSLVDSLAKLQPIIPLLGVSMTEGVDRTVLQYNYFMELFARAGLHPRQMVAQTPNGPEETGLVIEVTDPSRPTMAARALKKVLDSASVETKFGRLPDGYDKSMLVLFSAPAPY